MTEVPLYLDYFERLRRLDRRGAVALVRGYLAERDDVEGLYVDVLMPALIHTGREWERDRISVAHEHYISEVTRDLVRQFGPRLWSEPGGTAPAPVAVAVAVACCPPGERHALGLLMIGDVLRAEGLEVHMLGEGAPAGSVRDFVVESGADLLCLSVALEDHLPEAAGLIALTRAARPGLAVMAGGAAFAGDAGRARGSGADHFAADARAARWLIRDLWTGKGTGTGKGGREP